MRRLVLLLVLVASLAGAESAHALSCAYPPSVLARYQAADVAVAATLVSSQEVGPPLEPEPGQPFIPGWGPTGPAIRATYRVVRVFKSDRLGPRLGDEFALTGRVERGAQGPPWPRTTGFLLERGDDGSLDGSLGTGPCAPGPPSRTELRMAARLHRYGEGGGAADSICVLEGSTCASIKRDGREAILRLATYAARGTLTRFRLWGSPGVVICVRAPDESRACRSFKAGVEVFGLTTLRARWSRHFPDRGHGIYRVRWMPSDLEESGYSARELGRHLPLLEFRR